jgi:hypothetical protein
MSEVQQWFEEARAIADPIRRAEALCDLAFDAEHFLREGRHDAALELAQQLASLDACDDLLHPAIESADRILVSLGVRKRLSLEEVIASLHERFSQAPERERLLAVARALAREHGSRNPEAWLAARGMLEAAAAIQPLRGKELRFQAEVLQHTARQG